jgi:hypothetical protein
MEQPHKKKINNQFKCYKIFKFAYEVTQTQKKSIPKFWSENHEEINKKKIYSLKDPHSSLNQIYVCAAFRLFFFGFYSNYMKNANWIYENDIIFCLFEKKKSILF